jgi:GNAT superfamily N-acetyltransferase
VWEAHSRSQYGEHWVADDPIVVTGRRHGEVVGAAEGHTRGADGYLARLVVAPEVRGEGVGSHLLARFADECRRRGCDVLVLRTLAGSPAEAFYRAHGFTTVVVLPRWRLGRDFVQLRRPLAATLPT